MTQLTIKIDEITPEIQKTLEHLKALSGVTIEPEKSAKTKSKWDEAIEAGAISLDEFGNRFKEEIHKAYRS